MKRWLKNKTRQLASFCYRLTVALLEFLSEHNILVNRHKNFYTRMYPISSPKVYRSIDLLRYKGRLEYAANRLITKNELWYYFKWAKDDVKKAILVIDNSITDIIEIQMKAEVSEFLFHPPRFEHSVWVSRERNRVSAVNKYTYSPLINPDTCMIDKPMKVDIYEIDFDQARAALTMKFDVEGYKVRESSYLKLMSDRMMRELNLMSSDFQLKISGVEDSYTFRKGIFIEPNIVCRNCGAPVLSFHSNRRCVGDCCSPDFIWNSRNMFRHVGHSDWEMSCEQFRNRLNDIQHEVGLDT